LTKPHVELDVQHRMGSFELRAKLAITAPWTVLFGPSGSGKSTLLRMIAGFAKPQTGYIRIADEVVCDTQTRIWVPPHRRALRWSGQKTTLFPLDAVYVQVMFAAGDSSDKSGVNTGLEAMDHFKIDEHLGKKKPPRLSGGQQQRIAVIRAAAGARGKLLLLDEPFTGLDASIREELILQLRSWLGDTPVISVTHDVGEAFLLGAEIVKIADGHIVAQGPVAETLAEERAALQSILR
jgi:molybdate transport system ATP-binding protein